MFKFLKLLSLVLLFSSLMPLNLCNGSFLGDTFTAEIVAGGWSPYNPRILPPTQYVVGPGYEYYYYDAGSTFIIERTIDISADTISVSHWIDYTGSGGGNIYDFNIMLSDLDWVGPPENIVPQLIEQRGSAGLVDGGVDENGVGWALFALGGEGTYGGSFPVDNFISFKMVAAPVPIPSAVWLLGSGLIGLLGFRKKFKK